MPGVHGEVIDKSAMVTEIEKLEAAARMAMGHFEGHGPTAAKPRSRLPHPVYALLAVTVAIGLAVTLLSRILPS